MFIQVKYLKTSPQFISGLFEKDTFINIDKKYIVTKFHLVGISARHIFLWTFVKEQLFDRILQ